MQISAQKSDALGAALERLTAELPSLSAATLEALDRAWGGDTAPTSADFMRGVLKAAEETPGPVLACGSGLSTLVLALVAEKRGQRVVVLEDSPTRAERLTEVLEKSGLGKARVLTTPLWRYAADYAWYDVDGVPFEQLFTLVVCEGPPAGTHGGRSGLRPVMGEHLAPGAAILTPPQDRRSRSEAPDAVPFAPAPDPA